MTGPELKTLRRSLTPRVTQKELAKTLRVHHKHVGHWEQGNRNIPPYMEIAILRAFAVLRAKRGKPARDARRAVKVFPPLPEGVDMFQYLVTPDSVRKEENNP